MVTILPKESDWSDVGQNLTSGFLQGYANRSDENAIKKTIEGLPKDANPRQVMEAILGTKTYGKEAKKQATENYFKSHDINLKQEALDITKAEANRKVKLEEKDRLDTQNIVNQLDIPEEQKPILGQSLSKAESEKMLRDQLKPKKEEKLTPFENKVAEKNAEEYINLTKDLPELEDTLETINYARKLSKEIGYLGTGLSAIGLSQKGKELESVSFPLIKPILKMLAPSGAIAKEKLIRAEQKFNILGSDAPWLREAKLDAIERFTKQTLNRVKSRLALIKEYNGMPPDNVINKFDKESETIADAMLDYDLIGEEAKLPNMPDAKQYKGEEIDAPDGNIYYSDGIRWLKK